MTYKLQCYKINIGDIMNFRNKTLGQVFEERYQANHNKELQDAAKNNKKSLTDRMFGNNNQINKPNNVNNNQNNPIGYNPNKNSW